MTTELETKLSDIGSGIEKIQKEYATKGELTGEIKGFQEKLDNALKEYQSIKDAAAAEKKNQDFQKEVEARLSRPGVNSKGENEVEAEYKKSFASYLRKQKSDISSDLAHKYAMNVLEKEYAGTESKSLDIAAKGLNSGIGPDGGYFIMPQRGEIIKGRYFETSPIRDLANVMSIAADEIAFPLDDGEIGGLVWNDQTETASEGANPKVATVKILAHEAKATQASTQTMLDDFPNIENWLMEKINDKFDRGTNTQFVIGDGASKPKGFLSYPAWSTPSTIAGVKGVYERNKIEQISSGSSGAFTYAGLKTLQSALLSPYQNNAVFLMQRMAFNSICLLVDGFSRPLIDPMLLKSGTDLTMLGRPVVFADDMQAQAGNSLSVAYGDFKRGYTIVERLGLRVLRNPFVQHPNILFQCTKRIGGEVTNFEAIKLLKLA